MGLSLMIMVYRYAMVRGYSRSPRVSLRELIKSAVKAIPPLMTPVILVGGIMGGIFTPTEAGAVAALYALALGIFFYRNLGFKKIKEVILDSAWTTATVMLIVMAASLFAYIITRERIPVMVGEFILSLTQNKYLILLIINAFLLFVGFFLEPVAAMIILIPIFLPVCHQMGINMVHFGVMMVLNLMIGLLTPPVGLVLYVVSDVANIPFEKMVKATFPFLLPLVICLLIVTYLPETFLWLPRIMGLL